MNNQERPFVIKNPDVDRNSRAFDFAQTAVLKFAEFYDEVLTRLVGEPPVSRLQEKESDK